METIIIYLTARYLARVKLCQNNIITSNDGLMSGWLCLMFIILLPSTLRTDTEKLAIQWKQSIERAINFVVLYMMIDHYLDSPNTTSAHKQKLLKWMSNPDIKPQCTECDDSFYTALMYLYNSFDVTTAYKKKLVAEFVHITMETLQLEKEERTVNEHLAGCHSKGGITVFIASVLVYDECFVPYRDELIELGGHAQLIDDMMDCSQDRNDGINTACTKELATRGNLDRLAVGLIKSLAQLPAQYELYGWAMARAVMYIVNRSEYYSIRLKGRWWFNTLSYSIKRRAERTLRKYLTA
jgi:hypothetical protein